MFTAILAGATIINVVSIPMAVANKDLPWTITSVVGAFFGAVLLATG